MDQLLDEVDSLQHSDLTTLAGSWCESCETLRQEVKQLQEDQVQNFGKLKQKIISTDLLIKKYKSKCDDYDNQSKRLEETTRRLEKAQRQSETLELQLKSSLLETEPLRKTKQNLEVELRLKNAELEEANNKMVCAQGLQQQIQGENKYLQEQLDKMEAEKRELKEKLHFYKKAERDEETVKSLKAEMASMKKEVSRLNRENSKLLKKEKSLETKLQDTTEKMNHFCNVLKKHKLLSAAKKSLGLFRSPGKSFTGSDSDMSSDEKDSLLQKDIRKSLDTSESSDDDGHSAFQIPWVLSPLKKCLSPLPPSPACFSRKQKAMNDENGSDDDYLSDLAEELENQLMDILSEDEISELENNGKTEADESDSNDSSPGENSNSSNVLASFHDDNSDFMSDNTTPFKQLSSIMETEVSAAECSKDEEDYVCTVIGDKSNLNCDRNLVEIDGDNFPLTVERAQINDSECICKDILDKIVNEILGDTDDVIQKQEDKSLEISVEQTIYCDDTTLIKTPLLAVKQDTLKTSETVAEDKILEEKKDKQIKPLDKDGFKSPKSLKERLRDAAQEISPVCTRQKSSPRVFKRGSNSAQSPDILKSFEAAGAEGNADMSKQVLNNAHNDKCSEINVDQNANLNRSDTGEFTPVFHEMESPSSTSKDKSGFFISDQESTYIHSLKSPKLFSSDDDSSQDAFNKNSEATQEEQINSKPVLKRQMALRKDSSSDIVPDKKVCSKVSITQQSTVHERGSKRITRSKSMPNKFIKFQKGTCETLEEERTKYNVSKGGYGVSECDQNIETDKSDYSIASDKDALMNKKDHKFEVSAQDTEINDSLCNENNDASKSESESETTEIDIPVAKRTRRSTRLLSLSENKEGKTLHTKEILGKDEHIMDSKSEVKKGISCIESGKNLNETNLPTVCCRENLEEENILKNLVKENSETEQTKNDEETCEKSKTDLQVDFRGDSQKPTYKNISETSNIDIGVDVKGEAQVSSHISKETVSKTTPTRQISTGFQLHISKCSDKTKGSASPVTETIMEESEDKRDLADCDTPSAIVDGNDNFSDNINDNAVKGDDEITNKAALSDEVNASLKDVSVVGSLLPENDEEGNKNKAFEQSLFEDVSSPIPNPSDLFQSVELCATEIDEKESAKSSPVLWQDSALSGDELDAPRLGSATPDNFLIDDTPVLSPLPISPFELVDLISPLPPTPSPIDEALSPLSEDVDADKITTDAGKSQETIDSEKSNTLESKLPVNKKELDFSPLPAMLSPILTPKRHTVSEKKESSKGTDNIPKPCKFISEVLGIVNVKPKAIHPSDLKESASKEQNAVEIENILDIANTQTVLSHNNSDLKENMVPNITSKILEKHIILKSAINEAVADDETSSSVQSDNVDKKKIAESIAHIGKETKEKSSEKQVRETTQYKTIVTDSEKIQTDVKASRVVPEMSGAYDNLVASKTKTRQAHLPKTPRIPVKKPVPIIEAPALPVNRKRKSMELEKDKNKEIDEKKPHKEQVFKRRQKSESKAKSAVNKVMQSFLKSSDLPNTIISKFESEEGEGKESAEYRAVTACFECLSRIRNDTLEVVHQSCTTEDYLNIIDDWPYLFPVEKQAVELCWHVAHGEKQTMSRSDVMEELWKRIFDSEHGTSISGKKSLCRLFTALCFKAGNVEEVRVLCYHIVLCGYMNVTSFLVPIISVWPETLRREDDNDHGMIIVLEYLLMQMLTNQENSTLKQIKECAMKLCNWVEDRETADNILVKLLKRLQEASSHPSSLSQVFELTKSLELLSMKEGTQWFFQSFVCRYCLQTVSNKWQAKGRNCGLPSLYVCSVLKITANVLCHFSVSFKQFSDTIRHWILPILRKEPSCQEVRNCCIETLLEVSAINPKVMCNLQGWFYMFKGTIRHDLELRMETLRQAYATKFELVCDPIRRQFKPTVNQ